jgi:lipoprotein LpqH
LILHSDASFLTPAAADIGHIRTGEVPVTTGPGAPDSKSERLPPIELVHVQAGRRQIFRPFPEPFTSGESYFVLEVRRSCRINTQGQTSIRRINTQRRTLVKRAFVIAVGGAAILAGGLVGCSGDKSAKESASSATDTAKSAASSASSAATSATDAVKGNPAPGEAQVTIDGQDQNVTGTVVCTAMGGNYNIAIGEAATAIAVVMTEDAAKVTSVGLGNVNGIMLGFQDGAPGGNASATKDGSTYKVTGTATGVDMANPTQPVTKPFEIAVTCP